MGKFDKYVGRRLTFYCVKCRRKHPSKVERVAKKGKVAFAISTCDKHGNTLYRILGRA